MTVYVDVLIAVNLFVNYVLLTAAKAILRQDAKTVRLVLAAFVGAAYSLIIFVPGLTAPLRIPLDIALLSLIVFIAFRPKRLKSFLRQTAAFLLSDFIFAGLMFALWFFIAPKGMIVNNSVVYFDIDIKLLIILCAVCYAVLRLCTHLVRRAVPKNRITRVTLSDGGRSVSTNALIDSGNSLKDAFSGAPVIIADESVISALIGESLGKCFLDYENGKAVNRKIRLIPVSTVASSTSLKAVSVEDVLIGGGIHYRNVWLAQSNSRISTDEYSVILNNDFIKGEKYNAVR